MNDILRSKPATRPTIVIDSLQQGVVSVDDTGDVVVTDSVSDGVEIDGENASGDENSGGKLGESDVQLEQVKKKPKVKKERQRKKRTKEDKFEKAMDVIIHKVTKAQESDEMLMKLEGKRIKLDERMMEMEDRRWSEEKEREERQTREEREFQFRMMVMQWRSMRVPPPPFSPGFNYGLQSSSI